MPAAARRNVARASRACDIEQMRFTPLNPSWTHTPAAANGRKATRHEAVKEPGTQQIVTMPNPIERFFKVCASGLTSARIACCLSLNFLTLKRATQLGTPVMTKGSNTAISAVETKHTTLSLMLKTLADQVCSPPVEMSSDCLGRRVPWS